MDIFKYVPVTGPRPVEPLDNTFSCPICGNGNVHLGPVTIQQGPDYMVVGRGNEITDRYSIPASDNVSFPDTFPRGSSVTMQMWCEDGHQWQHTIGFHKGTVYAFMMREPDYEDEDGSSVGVSEELWRD